MKFTLNNFYSNNYKDFIHLEALKNILRQVPQLNLAGVENIDNVLSMEFSVDDWGENPMYIKYIDSDSKEHIVKIRPAVTEQIYEILKAYAKITYVDEQDKKLKDELHTEITQGDESTLNVSKAYTDTVVNHAKDEINHTIETTKQELKNYCDNKCEIILASSKEYTDTKALELNQRIDEQTNSLNGKLQTVKQEVTNNSEQITAVNQLVTANDTKTAQALADVKASVDSINGRFDKLSVGGTNLMRNTTRDYVKFTGDGWGVSYLTPNNRPIDTPVIGGETYTFSAQVKNDSSSAGKIDLEIYQYNANNGNTQNGSSSEINAWVSPGEEKRLVFTKKLLADTTKVRLHARNRDNNGTVTYWTKMPKVEKGNIPTDWSPAPEDEIERVSQLNENIKRKTTLYTTTEGETGETSYPRATFKKLTNGDISFNPGAPTDPTYGYLLNETQLTKLKNLNETPTGTPSDIKYNGTEDVTKINFLAGNPDRVLISTATGTKMNSAFITPTEKTNITNLLSWKTNVTDELTRMNGGITELATKQDEINHTIETTKQDLKGYCDNKCALTLASSKEYTDTKIADKTIELTSDYTQKINEVSKKVDDLDIGGTNLLWGTDTYVNDFWTLPVSNGISHGEREDDGLLSQSIHIFGDDNKAKENMATNWRPIHLIAGHQYTISLQARYHEPNRADTKVTGRNIRVFSDYTDVHEPEGFGLTTELTGEYKRYSHTFTCKQTGDYRGWRFGDWTDAVGYPGGSIYIGEIKIEEGNIPTAWRTAEGELTSRLRGTVENVPKEFFMSLNNTVLDTNSCYARLFKFTDFAIVKISCYIKGVTIEPWTYRDVVSAPKAYFKDFSKFDYIKGKKEFSDLGRPYEAEFNITNSKIGIYCRGTKIEKEDLFLEIAGILYN